MRWHTGNGATDPPLSSPLTSSVPLSAPDEWRWLRVPPRHGLRQPPDAFRRRLGVLTRQGRSHGEDAVATWGLFLATPDGESRETIAIGHDLAVLAMRVQHAYAISDS